MALAHGGELPNGILFEVLRQTKKPAPASARQELRDSLVARATQSDAAQNGSKAVFALTMAGSRTSHRDGQPDEGALEALIAIHRGARHWATRISALGSMSDQTQPARALSYLKTVVESNSEGRALALKQVFDIEHDPDLAQSEREEAGATLRALYDERIHSEELCAYAIRHKWTTLAECSG